MSRDEILKKVQAENRDESEEHGKDKSMGISYVVMGMMAAVFSFVRAEQGLPMMDLCATGCGSVCAAMTYRFIQAKQKNDLIIALITFVAAAFAIVRFAMGH